MRSFRALVLALVFVPALAGAQSLPDKSSGYVTDAAHVLSDATRTSLETELAALDASTTEQVAVVTVPDMGGDYIEHYAAALFQKWGIGQAKEDNGVLLVLAIEERKLRIEVGYGLEGALPDSVASTIIAEDMTPLLKAGEYDAAVEKGVASIIAAIRGEYAAPASADSASQIDPFALIVFGLFALQFLASILAQSKTWWSGGILGAIVGVVVSSIFGWWILGGIVLTVNLLIFGLLFDYIVSRMGPFTSSSTPWIGGPGGFSGGSSSGGFGGFGGGSSGGGGASGGW